MIKRFGLVAVLLPTGALGEILAMDSTKVLPLVLSDQGLTRLTIDGEGIKEMFAHPTSIQPHVSLHESGHVFIAGEGLKEPIYMTVISASGHPQDLKISFAATKKAAPVVLRPVQEFVASKEQIDHWLQVALTGVTPTGFKQERETALHRVSPRAIAQERARFSRQGYVISLCTVRNRTADPIALTAADFCESEEAGLLGKASLSPGEETSLAFIRKH